MTHVEKLVLSGMIGSDMDVEFNSIFANFEKNESLRTLDLSGCTLEDFAGIKVAKFLQTNPPLIKLMAGVEPLLIFFFLVN